MKTDPHYNQILDRFNIASSLQSAAHYFDLKATTKEDEKVLNNMLVDLLTKESNKIASLGLAELKQWERHA